MIGKQVKMQDLISEVDLELIGYTQRNIEKL